MKLIVLKNNIPANEVEVEIAGLEEGHEIYVGRAADCHVIIDDPLISRHHFVIKNEGQDWFCEKLTQLGVVLVNGNLGPKTRLAGNDEIKCGVYSIIVTDLPSIRSPSTAVSDLILPKEDPPLPVDVVEMTSPENVDKGEEKVDENPLSDETSESFSEGSGDFTEEVLGEAEDASVLDEQFESSDEQGESSFGGEEGTALDSFADEQPYEEGGGSDNESTRFFKAFVNYQLVLFGDKTPYDRYQIDTDEVFIGRDPKKCQIVLDDPEVSSIHAVLKKSGNDVTLEDLNSSNGTILNAERINRAHVNTGDDFIIGSTTFTLEVKSDLLETEEGRLMPVEKDQVIETEEILEEEVTMNDIGDINFASEAVQEKSIIKRILKNPQQRKKALMGLVAVMLLWLVLDDEKKDIPQANADQKVSPTESPEAKKAQAAKQKIKLSPEQTSRMQIAYELGVNFFEQAKYQDALNEFEVVNSLDNEYKKIQSYLEQTKLALKRLEELETQRRAEADRIEKKKKIEEFLVKAREAVKEKKVPVAESFFSQITELDPENMEIGQLKLELETWQKEEEKKALEEAVKVAARKKMVDSLAPGKTSYLKKEWYRAILKLEEFMRIKGMDEDLVKEGSEMLSDAKNQLASELGPLLGKARSLKEGQDHKNAYEAYLEILKLEPTNAEALNEVDEIKSELETRSRRMYREAIISESLSLFSDAKEKFQEVQQISPTDSEYYRKSSDKLKNYME